MRKDTIEKKHSKPFFSYLEDINEAKLEGKKKKKVMPSKKKFDADDEHIG